MGFTPEILQSEVKKVLVISWEITAKSSQSKDTWHGHSKSNKLKSYETSQRIKKIDNLFVRWHGDVIMLRFVVMTDFENQY